MSYMYVNYFTFQFVFMSRMESMLNVELEQSRRIVLSQLNDWYSNVLPFEARHFFTMLTYNLCFDWLSVSN